ncbi:MAG: type II toxin-antitoxin system VapC family toxin [Tepidisphaerales bacterium]
MRLLLDTCAMIWFAEATSELSPRAYEAIGHPENQTYVSPVSLMEIACLVQRSRIQLTEHWRVWWHRQLDDNGWSAIPITSEIAAEAFSLPEPIHRDPADRLLIATARIEDMTPITGDSLILDFPHVRTLR